MRTHLALFSAAALVIALAACHSSGPSQTQPSKAAESQPAPATTPAAEKPDDHRMDWWREARFGMFIHWGLYAIPAGEWDGKTSYGEWIRHEARIPVAEYEKFKDQFNPVKFDADEWVRLAKAAGMKYIV